MRAVPQAILFRKDTFTKSKAEKWLKDHNYTPIKKVHITNDYLRYRLREPNSAVPMRIISLTKGIRMIVMIDPS